MNNKAQSLGIFAGIMVGLMVFIVAVQFIGPIKEQIQDARDVSALDCTNSSITTAMKGTCIIVDWTLPYFIAIIIAVGAGTIIGFGTKKLGGQ